MKKWGLLFAILISVSPVFGVDLTVPGMYATIQQAIDIAFPSDVVSVSPGVYTENLNLGSKSITLTSLDPEDPNVVAATIIDGGGSGSVISCNGVDTTCVIAGFWIQNGNTNSNGGGISCNNSDLTIKNCVLSSNAADNFGGGIFCWSGAPTILNCRFIGNFCDGYGGGLGCYQSDATVLNCEFSGNDGFYGGGITCYESDMIIRNCTISANVTRSGTFGGYGGAIYFDDDNPAVGNTPLVTNCLLWDNFATHGNEIHKEPGKINPTISYNDIQGCGGSGANWDSSLGTDGGYNMDTDPNIIDADGADNLAGTEDDNLHLDIYSVCINAGDPNGTYIGQSDMDYADRVRYGVVDIGADEVYYIGSDLNLDGQVGVADLVIFADSAMWLVGVDFTDFAKFATQWAFGAGGSIPGDLNGDGQVDLTDLMLFVDSDLWLIQVDFTDYATLAAHWLEGVE